jgi:hypothetical protein
LHSALGHGPPMEFGQGSVLLIGISAATLVAGDFLF